MGKSARVCLEESESTVATVLVVRHCRPFEGVVLGCADPERLLYAVYLPEIGYEHRFVSQKDYLEAGEVLLLKVESVNPRMSLMTLSLINIG